MPVLSANPRNIHDGCKEAVADSLLNNLAARLAGRREFYQVIYGNKPSAVLSSEFLVPKPLEERAGDEEANPIQISAHGLDFQIDKAARTQPISASVRGAVYVRILPNTDDVKPGGVLEPTFTLDPAVRDTLNAITRSGFDALRKELGIGAGMRTHPDWPARSQEIRRKAHESLGIPYDVTLDRSDAEESSNEEELSQDDESGDTPPIHGARGDMPDNVALPLAPPQKWLRLELDLPGFSFAPATAPTDAVAATSILNAAIAAQIAAWASSTDTQSGGKNWGFRHGLQIHPSNVRDWNKFLEATRASNLVIVVPNIDLRWAVQVVDDPLDAGRTTIHVALENWSQPNTNLNRKEVENSVFQVGMSVSLAANNHRPLRLDRVKPSYRYNQYLTYPALGFNSGVTASDADAQRTLTTTWTPRYVLPRIDPIDHGVERNIARLASPDGLAGLEPLVAEFEKWIKGVESYPVTEGLDGKNAEVQRVREVEKLQLDLEGWRAELSAIRTGLDLLKKSAKHWSGPGPQANPLGIPFEAWLCMNAAMARVAKKKNFSDWRLFQLAFILASVPTFATRIPVFHDFYTADVSRNANAVTLLYFATGGGKSEAFLGLLVFVLFLDRLRGKHHGVSALMRYPLRLLTLQQARRTFATLGAAEAVRNERKHPGEPFSLGFWVGGTNTPNWHRDEGYKEVHSVADVPPEDEPKVEGKAPYKLLKERWLKLDRCPFCDAKGKLAMRRASGKGGNLLGYY